MSSGFPTVSCVYVVRGTSVRGRLSAPPARTPRKQTHTHKNKLTLAEKSIFATQTFDVPKTPFCERHSRCQLRFWCFHLEQSRWYAMFFFVCRNSLAAVSPLSRRCLAASLAAGLAAGLAAVSLPVSPLAMRARPVGPPEGIASSTLLSQCMQLPGAALSQN